MICKVSEIFRNCKHIIYGEKPQSKTTVPLFYSCFDQAMSAWNFLVAFILNTTL